MTNTYTLNGSEYTDQQARRAIVKMAAALRANGQMCMAAICDPWQRVAARPELWSELAAVVDRYTLAEQE